MSKYLIDESFANALIAYMVDRPYREVYQFVAPLQALQPAPKEPEHVVNYLKDQLDEINAFITQSKLVDAYAEFHRNRTHSMNDDGA